MSSDGLVNLPWDASRIKPVSSIMDVIYKARLNNRYMIMLLPYLRGGLITSRSSCARGPEYKQKKGPSGLRMDAISAWLIQT